MKNIKLKLGCFIMSTVLTVMLFGNINVEAASLTSQQKKIYKECMSDYLNKTDWLNGKKLPGFYAEDVYSCFPQATQLNENGEPEDWNFRVIIPAMLRLIQNLYEKEGLNNE